MKNKRNYTSKKISFSVPVLLFVTAIILFATTLRTPLTSVGPVTPFIRDDLGISYSLAGFLTTIPLLAFAIISPFAPKVARKLGMEWTLLWSLVLIIGGIILRSLGYTPTLLIGTVLIGIAIAFGNVLFPSFFKMKYPLHIGLLTAIYSVSMNLSSGLGAGVSYPIATGGFGWQGALGSSIVLALLAFAFWLPQLKGDKLSLAIGDEKSLSWRYFFKSPLAIAIMLSMGLQSFIFYSTAAWIPEIYIAQGFEPEYAGWLVTIMLIAQIPMTFLTPIIATKMTTQRPIVALFTLSYLIGFTGLIMEWSSLAVVWVIFIGFGGGASFALAMMLFTLRTKTAYEAAEISSFAQSLGYLLAASGPFLFGFLKDMTGSFFVPSLTFIIIALFLCIAGMISGSNRLIRP